MRTNTTIMTPQQQAKINFAILFFTMSFIMSVAVVVITTGGLIGSELAPNKALTTVPITIFIVGVFLAAVPAGVIMKKFGRKTGLVSAAIWGMFGCILGGYALDIQSFLLFCVSVFMLGNTHSFAQQTRFVVTEGFDDARKPRVVSLYMLLGIATAFIGPELIMLTDDLSATSFVATFFVYAGIFGCAAIILLGYRNIATAATASQRIAEQSRLELARSPLFFIPMLAALAGYMVMSFLMTATSVSMHVIDGMSIDSTAAVIQAHVLAMYLPSIIIGVLIEKLGFALVIRMGVVFLLASPVAAQLGHELHHYYIALILLGVGWNCMFVGGTVMLERRSSAAHRIILQSSNDFCVFGGQALVTIFAGALLYAIGWERMNQLVIPLLLLYLALTFVYKNVFTSGAKL